MYRMVVALVVCVVIGVAAGCDQASSTAPVAADNTGQNKNDTQGGALTAQDQSNSEADRALTQRIRQAIVQDDSLSMNAHNVKIIAISGMVTLKGPVDSAEEKARVAAKAEQIAGAGRVSNQLEVATN